MDEAEGIRAVHTALDCGINYFDVAPAYGGTVSETVLGKALKGIPRDRYYLSTKVGQIHQPGELRRRHARLLARPHPRLARRKRAPARHGLLRHHPPPRHRVPAAPAHRVGADAKGWQTLLELKQEGRIGAVSFGIYPMDLWQRIFRDCCRRCRRWSTTTTA